MQDITDFWDLVIAKHNRMPVYFGTTLIQTSHLTTMGIERPVNRLNADLSILKDPSKKKKPKELIPSRKRKGSESSSDIPRDE